MRVLIFDITEEELKALVEVHEDDFLIPAGAPATYCKGCFGCWLKRPGECVMKDRLEKTGSLILQAEQVVIISRCVYGGYSPAVKKVMDRGIPGVMPFFVKKEGEMHHSARYDNRMDLKVFFYGDITAKEKKVAEEMVKANGLNFWAESTSVSFVNREELKEVAL